MYIHMPISHMAPYGAGRAAPSTARSCAQFEAERPRKGFRGKNESVFEASKPAAAAAAEAEAAATATSSSGSSY